MNKYEKEIEKVLLDNEKEILKKLKKSYAEALEKVNQRLKDLMSNELTQSRRYQLEYQKRLRKEIVAIIDLLSNDNINNIEKYLSKVYEDSFIGTQYILQNDGVSFLYKINQEEVIKSISKKIEDYKLSERIYKNLDKLKEIVQNEITRGIIQGYTYSKISRQLKFNMENDLKKAYRIARTEAGRVTMEAKYSCMKITRKNGVDIVKMWDSTIDNRTRNSHVQLDGQIKELDEPFEINGHKAMYPHNFGIAKEDINCRCGMLSRVRKGLEYDREHVFTKMVEGERKEFKNIEDYNDFKRKYFDFYKKNDKIVPYIRKNVRSGYNTINEERAIENALKILPNKLSNTLHEKMAFEIITKDIKKFNYSGYDRINKIIYIYEGATEYEVIHEIGHFIEDIVLKNNKEYLKLKQDLIDSSKLTVLKRDDRIIYALKNENFIEEYQGYIHVKSKEQIYDKYDKVDISKVTEIFSESFREYFENRENLKNKLPEFYRMIKELLQ